MQNQWPTDPVLVEFLPEFVDQWLSDLGEPYNEMLERHNVEELNRLGHTIKGSFLQFGFKDLSVTGKELMLDAQSENWIAYNAKVNVLKETLHGMKNRLNAKSTPGNIKSTPGNIESTPDN
ncbi:MAG: Hpt domain-containing protein [bacterium]|nr:Hpt domain-containing protein [bacterium]